MRNRNPQQRFFFGIAILVVGVLALINNMNFFNTSDLIPFWPVVFIVLGALKISQSRGQSGAVIGGGLILLGSIMTLNHLGILNIHMRQMWPIFLIGLGIMVLLKDKNKRFFENGLQADKINSQDATIDIVAVMSGSQGNIASQAFKGGEISAVMGGVELDLRNASIETEAVINVFAFWGGISLKIPSDWSVVNNGSAIMGGIEDSTVPNMAANKRLIITGTVVMGGVEIKN